jgi:hypothetical protein
MEKECLLCFKKFTHLVKHTKYCSRECQKKYCNKVHSLKRAERKKIDPEYKRKNDVVIQTEFRNYQFSNNIFYDIIKL